MPAADAPQVAGAPDCTVFPADNVWNKPVDGLLGRLEQLDADLDHRQLAVVPHGLRLVRGLRDPVPGRRRRDAAARRHLRLRRRVRPRSVPDPGDAARSRAARTATCSWSTGTRASCTSCSPRARSRAAPGTRAAARSGTSRRTRCGRTAGRQRRRRRPADPARARPLRRGRGRRHRPRAPVHDPRTRTTYIYPATHEASSSQRVAAADGPARAAQGDDDTTGFSPRREGHRGRAQALRDDPRGQRVALVRVGRERPALRRRRAAPAGPFHGSDLEVVDTSGLVNGP